MNGFELLHDDCSNALKRMTSNLVDLVITSPPYDYLRSYNGNIDQWSFEKFQNIARELYRVIKPGGVVVWIVADATVRGSETGTSFRQALYFIDCGFNLHDTMIWRKPNAGSVGAMNRYENVFEYMFVFSKGKPKVAHIIKDRKNKGFGELQHGSIRQIDGSIRRTSGYGKRTIAEYGRRHNVWDVTPCKSKTERLGHPAPFPKQLAYDHVVSWSDPDDVVLDPFMGSGTTGVVCANTGRKFIGIEIDAEYYAMSTERIEAAYFQNVSAGGS